MSAGSERLSRKKKARVRSKMWSKMLGGWVNVFDYRPPETKLSKSTWRLAWWYYVTRWQ